MLYVLTKYWGELLGENEGVILGAIGELNSQEEEMVDLMEKLDHTAKNQVLLGTACDERNFELDKMVLDQEKIKM